ncbi:MAG: 3-deoxy-7-phosphoheptulonate synthase, partial [Bacteroidia bacterium]|nr:3-deoxy-7-phosphoheptulonate synthase [Bacteroidia bacterium]
MDKSVCDVPMRTPFPIPERVDRKNNPEGSVIRIKGNDIGGKGVIIIAGPCAVESREQLFETARSVSSYGARILRGGAFKPRSSPYSFQGMGEEGLKFLKEISIETGMPVV